MDVSEQIQHFESDLNRLVERYRQEYQLPYAAVIGTLAMKQFELHNEAREKDGD